MSAPEALPGNREVTSRLKAKLAAARLPHALIFSGPEGVGKHAYALTLVKALNCREEGLFGCGECTSCQKIERGSHPDVVSLSVEEDASQIKIEQIRRLRDTLTLEPGEGTVRASIIDPAERLTAGAANALLKALEEPPPRTYFFLITRNPNELLVTIRSRCQTYHFGPLSLASIRESGISDELVARWSQGSLGRARGTDPDVLRQNRDQMLGFLRAGLTGGAEGVADIIGTKLAPSREEHVELIRAGYYLISDLLRLKLGVDQTIINVDILDQLRSLAETLTAGRLIEAAHQLGFVEANLRHYLNPQIMTDAALVSMSDPDK